MAVIVKFPKIYRPPPPAEREQLATLQAGVRDALANAVVLVDFLAEALALADELSEMRGRER